MIPVHSIRLSLLAAVAVSVVARVVPPVLGAQAPIQADGSAVPLTRFEMQRALLEIDEQRRKVEASLVPVDSVLRLLAADTVHVAGLKRAPVVDQDMATFNSALNQLAQFPGSPDLTSRVIDAATSTSRDFSVSPTTLNGRVLIAPAAQDYLSRNPGAAVVAVNDQLPPYDTPLWDKIRQSDYGKLRMARLTASDVAAFQAAVTDSGFEAYKLALIDAYTKRIGEIRQGRDASRLDVARLRRRAGDLARIIGEQDSNAQTIDTHLVDIGLPAFALVLIVLLLMPRMYPSEEMQRWMFTSGLVVELTTIVLITAATLLLAMANRIHAEVVGTLLGALSGYTLGRSVHRRNEALAVAPVAAPVAMPQVQPIQHTPVASARFR